MNYIGIRDRPSTIRFNWIPKGNAPQTISKLTANITETLGVSTPSIDTPTFPLQEPVRINDLVSFIVT
jgi:hypothetical protein